MINFQSLQIGCNFIINNMKIEKDRILSFAHQNNFQKTDIGSHIKYIYKY